jgi:uncharacterized membrane protein
VIPLSDKTPIKKRYSAFFNQDFPLDLILVGVWLAAGIIAIYLPVLNQTPVRVVLALPVLLFIPGYSLISALFPKEGDIDLITRITLSIGVSVAVVPLIGLGLNFTQGGIRLDPIVISLTLFTMILIFVAQYTRAVLPSQERFRMPFSAIAGTIREEILPPGSGRIDRLLSAALVLGILITLIITVFVITVPREGEQFTEFYILGENRTAANYPDAIRPGQNYPMYVGIVNHEYRDTRYTIETWMMHTEFDNVTNTSRIIAMNPNDRLLLTLTHNETRLISYNLSVNKTGYNFVEFLLFNEDVPGFEVTGSDRINASYRELHLGLASDEEEEGEGSNDQIIITS